MILLCASVETIIGPLFYSTLFHHSGINNPTEGTQQIILEISLNCLTLMMLEANARKALEPWI